MIKQRIGLLTHRYLELKKTGGPNKRQASDTNGLRQGRH